MKSEIQGLGLSEINTPGFSKEKKKHTKFLKEAVLAGSLLVGAKETNAQDLQKPNSEFLKLLETQKGNKRIKLSREIEKKTEKLSVNLIELYQDNEAELIPSLNRIFKQQQKELENITSLQEYRKISKDNKLEDPIEYQMFLKTNPGDEEETKSERYREVYKTNNTYKGLSDKAYTFPRIPNGFNSWQGMNLEGPSVIADVINGVKQVKVENGKILLEGKTSRSVSKSGFETKGRYEVIPIQFKAILDQFGNILELETSLDKTDFVSTLGLTDYDKRYEFEHVDGLNYTVPSQAVVSFRTKDESFKALVKIKATYPTESRTEEDKGGGELTLAEYGNEVLVKEKPKPKKIDVGNYPIPVNQESIDFSGDSRALENKLTPAQIEAMEEKVRHEDAKNNEVILLEKTNWLKTSEQVRNERKELDLSDKEKTELFKKLEETFQVVRYENRDEKYKDKPSNVFSSSVRVRVTGKDVLLTTEHKTGPYQKVRSGKINKWLKVPGKDMVFLETESDNQKPSLESSNTEPKPGDEVFAYTYSDGHVVKMSGILLKKEKIGSQDEFGNFNTQSPETGYMIESDQYITLGSSGSGVTNNKGELIGLLRGIVFINKNTGEIVITEDTGELKKIKQNFHQYKTLVGVIPLTQTILETEFKKAVPRNGSL